MHPLRREWLLFDDRGATWDARSVELRRRLSCPHYGGGLAADLVRNVGFVAGRSLGSDATVRLHPRVVSEVALAAVFYWLADHNPRRVLIDFEGENRPAEICTSAAAAIARLIELTQQRGFSRNIAERPCSLDQLSTGSPLRGLLEIWARNEGRFNEPALVKCASRQLLRRFLVVRQSASGRLLFDTIGDGLHVPDKSWFTSAIGHPIEDQPDTQYWLWVAKSHRATLRLNCPVLTDIDASIYWPSRGRVRRRYRRLLLPCTARDGTRFLFSANSAERRIALRDQVA